MASYDEVLAKMYEERLKNFYIKYDPAKVGGVAALLVKYKGKEDSLFTAMVKKYGPEPTAEELADDDDEDEEETDDENEAAASAKPDAAQSAEAVENDEEEEEEDDEEEEEEAPLVYCGICGMPPEYCEYGENYDKCVPWIKKHCPQLLLDEEDTALAKKAAKKGPKGVGKKDVAEEKQRILIYKETRSKKKFVTIVEGLETVNVKLKDAAKAFGKKFAAASAVKDTPSGGQEIVIQGDVLFDLPDFIQEEFNVPKSKITVKEKKPGK